MFASADKGGGNHEHGWRTGRWSMAFLLLLLPAVAMHFTDEVAWDLADFLVFGVMLVIACGAYELAMRATRNGDYRAAIGVALVTAFILVWLNLAVGVIGSANNPANLMFAGVLGVLLIGSIVARLRPLAMSYTLVATATAQTLAVLVALLAGFGNSVFIIAPFVALWLASAWLFRKAAQENETA